MDESQETVFHLKTGHCPHGASLACTYQLIPVQGQGLCTKQSDKSGKKLPSGCEFIWQSLSVVEVLWLGWTINECRIMNRMHHLRFTNLLTHQIHLSVGSFTTEGMFLLILKQK